MHHLIYRLQLKGAQESRHLDSFDIVSEAEEAGTRAA